MAAEPVTFGAMVALAMGLVKIIEVLVSKITTKKEDADAPSLKSVDAKIDRCAESLAKVAVALERQADTLERVEARLERTQEAVAETRFKILDGSH